MRNMKKSNVIALLVMAGSVVGVIHPTASAKAAVGGAAVVTVLVEEGGKVVKKALKSLTSEHHRFYPDGNVAIIPLGDLGGNRISWNLDHKTWVPRGSKPIKAKITIHGVPDEIRDRLCLVLKADKRARKDRDRNGGRIIHNGDIIEISYGTSGDRANYFVERGSDLAKLLPAGAYVRIERQ